MVQKKYDCVGIGMCSWDEFMLVPHYPAENLKIDILEAYETPGGPVLNALRILSALGKNTFYAGQVGNDYRGKKIQTQLKKEKINIPDEFLNSSIGTNYAHLWINAENATRTVCSSGSAEHNLSFSLMNDLVLSTKSILIDNRNYQSKIEWLKLARENGARVFCDFGSYRKGSEELLKYVDTAIFSIRFVNQRFKEMDLEKAILKIKKMGPEEIVVTDGENGIIIKENDKDIIKMDAFALPTVVDTTGAGDIFHGGWIFGFLENYSFIETARFASASGALQCQSFATKPENFNLININKIIENG